jgi:hypothetical protein
MALKPKGKNSESPRDVGDRLPPPAALLFKQDLEEHKLTPSVKARLLRVDAMLGTDDQPGQTG